MRNLRSVPLVAIVAGTAFAFGSLAAPPQSAEKKASGLQTEVGYVVSVKPDKLSISNVRVGGGGAPPAASAERRTMTFQTQQGKVYTKPGEGGNWTAQKKEEQDGDTQVKEESFSLDPSKLKHNPDGSVTISAEDAKKMNIPADVGKHNADGSVTLPPGGNVQVRRVTGEEAGAGGESDGNSGERKMVFRPAPEGTAAGAKMSGSAEPLRFSEFEVTAKTKKPAQMENGTKVKVTYTEKDGKKVATKIEAVKTEN